MKKLILAAVLFVVSTSTLFVSGQTYRKHKTLDNTAMFQKTSSTTATLKFESAAGNVVTKNCTNRRETADGLTYMVGNGDYITVVKNPHAVYFSLEHNEALIGFDISFYNSLDRKLWTCTVYPD